MGDFTQPQKKIAASGENCNFVIAANLCMLFGVVSTQIFYFLSKSKNIAKKPGSTIVFGIFFLILNEIPV